MTRPSSSWAKVCLEALCPVLEVPPERDENQGNLAKDTPVREVSPV